jgi:hypothetical protein
MRTPLYVLLLIIPHGNLALALACAKIPCMFVLGILLVATWLVGVLTMFSLSHDRKSIYSFISSGFWFCLQIVATFWGGILNDCSIGVFLGLIGVGILCLPTFGLLWRDED